MPCSFCERNFNMELRLSTECVDDPVGHPGVVVYEDMTFTISYKQGAPVGAGHGPHRNVAPSNLAADEVILMEVEEQERERTFIETH